MWRSICVACALLTFGTRVAAQDDAQRQITMQAPSAPQAFVNVLGFSGDYQVGPGDLLEIQVIGHDELKESVRVTNSGEINLQMLGLVRVGDLTSLEIEDEVARRLREGDLVRKPEVLVSVVDYQAKPIYVMGAVTTPGQLIMSQALTVSDAILLAGGLRFNAGDRAYLYRRGASPEGEMWSPEALAVNPGVARPGLEAVGIDLTPLREGRFDKVAIPLRRGDVVVVPDRAFSQFFVAGEVLNPRNYLYTPGKPLMASQALSWAGGPKPTAKLSEGLLVRLDNRGGRIEKHVDWAAILRGKEPDFPIEPNDIIFIPGSTVKTLTRGLLLLTDSMIGAAAFRIGRTYQLPDEPPRPTQPPQ